MLTQRCSNVTSIAQQMALPADTLFELENLSYTTVKKRPNIIQHLKVTSKNQTSHNIGLIGCILLVIVRRQSAILVPLLLVGLGLALIWAHLEKHLHHPPH